MYHTARGPRQPAGCMHDEVTQRASCSAHHEQRDEQRALPRKPCRLRSFLPHQRASPQAPVELWSWHRVPWGRACITHTHVVLYRPRLRSFSSSARPSQGLPGCLFLSYDFPNVLGSSLHFSSGAGVFQGVKLRGALAKACCPTSSGQERPLAGDSRANGSHMHR